MQTRKLPLPPEDIGIVHLVLQQYFLEVKFLDINLNLIEPGRPSKFLVDKMVII